VGGWEASPTASVGATIEPHKALGRLLGPWLQDWKRDLSVAGGEPLQWMGLSAYCPRKSVWPEAGEH
jgi:hypothetical protein